MNANKWTELGAYFPTFFLMELNTDKEVVDLNKMSALGKATLIHEYVHFLQDITTSYGVMKCIHIGDMLKTYYNAIQAQNSKTIEVPLELSAEDMAFVNRDLENLYYGHTEDIERLSISGICEKENGVIKGFETCQQVWIENAIDNQSFDFGVRALRESQAYLIEIELAGGSVAPDYPYHALSKIVRRLYPEFPTSNIMLIALADCAQLANFNGGHFLVETLKRMREDRHLPKDYREIYDYTFDSRIEYQGKLYRIMDFYVERSQIACRQYADLFGGSHNAKLREWLSSIFEGARLLRSANPMLLAWLVSWGREEGRREFSSITNRLGMPLIKFKDGQYSQSINSIGSNIQILSAYSNIFDLFSEGKIGCDMKEFCMKEPCHHVSLTCDEKPWEHVSNGWLCPYAQIWKTWGFEGKTPIRRA